MKKLLVHIGTHKTGTTSIQYALNSVNKEFRLKESWEYIDLPVVTKKVMSAEYYDNSLVDELSSGLKRKLSKESTSTINILSSECLSGSPMNGYLNSKIVAKILFDATKKYDVKIVMYIRLQDELVESMYSQLIHQGESISFDKYMSQLNKSECFNYKRIIQDWHELFGENNVIVRSYHTATKIGLLKDFGEIIGSSKILGSHMSSSIKNPGYSYDAIEIARIVNLKADRATKSVLRSALQKTMKKNRIRKHSLFLGDERERFLNRYVKSNHEISSFCSNLTVPSQFLGAAKDLSKQDEALHKHSVDYEDVAPLIEELLKSSVGIKDRLRVYIHNNPRLVVFLKKVMRIFRK